MNIEHIQLLRGTAEALGAKNPVLLAGELGIEIDTGKYKIGDGLTQWNSLAYSGLKVPSGDSVYVLKNGEYVAAQLVDMTEQWQPTIDDTADIVLAVDEDMTAYQLTGTNVTVAENGENENG